MPKCTLCNETTTDGRGAAAFNGWRIFDLHGPKGNKYINACPDHSDKEVKDVLVAAYAAVTGSK